jgi:GT2 family glycosyltransferase
VSANQKKELPGSPAVDLSVIIVSFNTRQLLQDCLASVFRTRGDLRLEIFVVDNASSDGSVEMVRAQFPEVILLANQVNVGYSTANNQALRVCRGAHILLLNSDTVVKPDVFQKCTAFMQQDPTIGALSCKVVLPSGELDLACRRSVPTPMVAFWRFSGLYQLFPKSRTFGQYNLTYLDEDETYEVGAIMGAFTLLSRECFLEVGLLDESFFMYGEDLDWCYRIHKAGFKIMYYPEVQIMHYKGASSKRRRPPKMVHEYHRAMMLFYRKYFARHSLFLVNWIISLGVWLHYGSDLLQSIPYFLRGRRATD